MEIETHTEEGRKREKILTTDTKTRREGEGGEERKEWRRKERNWMKGIRIDTVYLHAIRKGNQFTCGRYGIRFLPYLNLILEP